MKQCSVYILTSQKHGMLYVGLTGDLARRAWEHREGLVEGFTKTYGVKQLMHFEMFDEPEPAIRREKSLKKWPRDRKVNLIERDDPDWADFSPALTR